ncbi:Uncharacterised protein [Vibrio cholerae]|nr:Uncharacterised protein [Vibrio cholerae]
MASLYWPDFRLCHVLRGTYGARRSEKTDAGCWHRHPRRTRHHGFGLLLYLCLW